MSKPKMLLIVNSLLAVAIVVQAITGALVKYEVGPGEFWPNTHIACGVTLLVLTVIHLVLNWGWVRSNILKKKAKQS
jgi:hypothetical protein